MARLSKSFQELKWLCMSLAPAGLHVGLNNQSAAHATWKRRWKTKKTENSDSFFKVERTHLVASLNYAHVRKSIICVSKTSKTQQVGGFMRLKKTSDFLVVINWGITFAPAKTLFT